MPIRLITRDEVLADEDVFRRLTVNSESDMNAMLDSLREGNVSEFLAVAFEENGVTLGWATIYTRGLRPWRMMDVFVHPAARRRGVGRMLAKRVLDENTSLGLPKPLTADDPKFFWPLFKDQVVTIQQFEAMEREDRLAMFREWRQPNAVQSSSPVSASSSSTG